jgi:signal transduction histidine kinase
MSPEARRPALEFLGTLAGGLVHEIKNPLSTLRINLTLLKEDLQEDRPGERSRRLCHRIELLEKEVGRLDAILADFMHYAGMRRLDPRPHDLAGVVGEMVEFVGPGFRRDGVALETEVPAALEALLDPHLFKRALLNVLLNAQQAIEAEGTVRVTAAREGEWVRVEVRDDGRGISKGERERIFQVYYSGSKAGSGLPTARRILEEHGGRLELESTEGVGTAVRMWLKSA